MDSHNSTLTLTRFVCTNFYSLLFVRATRGIFTKNKIKNNNNNIEVPKSTRTNTDTVHTQYNTGDVRSKWRFTLRTVVCMKFMWMWLLPWFYCRFVVTAAAAAAAAARWRHAWRRKTKSTHSLTHSLAFRKYTHTYAAHTHTHTHIHNRVGHILMRRKSEIKSEKSNRKPNEEWHRRLYGEINICPSLMFSMFFVCRIRSHIHLNITMGDWALLVRNSNNNELHADAHTHTQHDMNS